MREEMHCPRPKYDAATVAAAQTAPVYDGAKIATDMIDEGWHVRPTWRPDRKEYAEGCGPRQLTKKEIDPSLFGDGRGVKLMGGTHRNGAFLAIIDDDSGGVIKARLDALGYRFLWAVSTSGDGYHGFAWFDLRVEGGRILYAGENDRSELKAEGDGVAYNPARFIDRPFPVRYPRELPRFNPAECSAILEAIGYAPKPAQVAPAQVETATTTKGTDSATNERDGIEVYNRDNDVRTFLSTIGAAQSATHPDMYHCPCGLHKHSQGRGKLEGKPSLQVQAAKRPGNGAYVVFVSSPACLFREYARNGVINAFDMRRAWEGITDKKEALKQFNPKPDWKRAEGNRDTEAQPARNIPVAIEGADEIATAQTDFNHSVQAHQDAVNAVFNADAMRAALKGDGRLNRCPSYRDVGLYMLENGGATFTGTKARIVQALDLGYEKVVQRAWNKLRDLGYGDRYDWGAAGYGGRVENEPATWAWAYVPAPALEAPALQVSTPHNEVSTPGALTEVSTLAVMPQNGEVSSISTEYICTSDPNNNREKKGDTDTNAHAREAVSFEGGAAYNPANDQTAQHTGPVTYASTGLATEDAIQRECLRLRDDADKVANAAYMARLATRPQVEQLAAIELAPVTRWVVPDERRGDYARLTNFAKSADRKGNKKQAGHFRRQAEALRVREDAPGVPSLFPIAARQPELFTTAAD